MAFTQFIVRRGSRPLKQGAIIGITQDIINYTASGDNTLVAAETGRIIKVHKLFIVGASASNVRFWSGPSSEVVPISGLMNFAANWAFAIDDDDFMLVTDAGKALVISSSAAIQTGGWLVYSKE